MGYNMKGWGGYQNSPMKQKQVPLSEHEDKKGTMIEEGSVRDEINDLEKRVSDLRSDLKGGSTGKVNVIAVGKQITKLEARLKKLRAK